MRMSSRHRRVLLGWLTAVLAVVVVANLLVFVAPERRIPGTGPAYPRIQQAAGIIDLLRQTDLGQRPAVLRAIDGTNLTATIAAASPTETAALRRAPRVEEKLREFAAPGLGDDLRAYTDAARPVRDFDTEGWPVRITSALPGGGVLVLTFIQHDRRSRTFLPAAPVDLLVAGIAIGVAGLSLLLARRETRTLARLTEAAERFDGTPPQARLEPSHDADLRRLAVALQRMEARVAGLLQERSFLIGAISHDLKTYLTRLRLRAESVPDQGQRERLAADLEAMTELIDTSLAFARGTTVSQRKTLVDLSDLVAVEVAERIALGQRVDTSAFKDDAVVLGDAVALRRVLTNLVDNALKFGRGEVAIALDAEGGCYRVHVDDDGPGIGEAERAAIFSPFYRLEGSRSRGTGGSGLGLAIARQIVAAHGGTVEAGSSSLGGARFTCSLPRFRS